MRNIHSWRVARNTAGACTGTLGACTGTRLARRPELARVPAHGCTALFPRRRLPPPTPPPQMNKDATLGSPQPAGPAPEDGCAPARPTYGTRKRPRRLGNNSETTRKLLQRPGNGPLDALAARGGNRLRNSKRPEVLLGAIAPAAPNAGRGWYRIDAGEVGGESDGNPESGRGGTMQLHFELSSPRLRGPASCSSKALSASGGRAVSAICGDWARLSHSALPLAPC